MAVLTSTGITFSDATTQASAFIGGRGQVFTSSGTFTVPATITAVKVTVVGGGGNGANVTTSNFAGGGGGGGGTAIEFVTGLTPGGTVTVTVGTAGNTSSFGSFCSATGGASVSTNGTAGGAGGAGSGGDINITGFAGGSVEGPWIGAGGGSLTNVVGSIFAEGVLEQGGIPGVGRFGGIGGTVKRKDAVVGAQTGVAGTGFGNGGSGGCTSNTADATGGAGSGGIVVVEF
jgi:hypothetical protein